VNTLARRSFVGVGAFVALVAGIGTGRLTFAQNGSTKAEARVIANFTVTLQPEVLHGFVLGLASANRGYVVEVSPLDTASDGAFVQSFVEPESNGVVWTDVLRLRLGAASGPINANITVYAIALASG
jgi:hypothetical protein